MTPRKAQEARTTTGEYENALEGLQSIAEAIEAALNQVGMGDIDEPGVDTEDVSPGPFTDEDLQGALETIASLVDAAEGILDGVGFPDPDEAQDTPARTAPAKNHRRKAQRVRAASLAEFRALLNPMERRALEKFERRCGVLGEREIRQVPQEVDQIAAAGNDAAFIAKGHAAVFDRKSLDLGGFQEKIAPGAFAEVLDTSPVVHFNWDHDMSRALASTDSQDYLLELREDPRGLFYYARVAPVSYAQDLKVLMKGGVIKQASFAFTVADDEWEIVNRDKPNEQVLRTIHKVGELFDVTVTAQGAYPQTDSQVVRAYAVSYARTSGRLDAEPAATPQEPPAAPDSEAVAPTAPQAETPEEPAVGASEGQPSHADATERTSAGGDPSLDSEGGDVALPVNPVLRAARLHARQAVELHRLHQEMHDGIHRGASAGA